jgi:hypothetical protein
MISPDRQATNRAKINLFDSGESMSYILIMKQTTPIYGIKVDNATKLFASRITNYAGAGPASIRRYFSAQNNPKALIIGLPKPFLVLK